MQPGAPGGQPPQGYGQPPQGYPPQGQMPMGPPPAANPLQTPAIIMAVCAVAILIGTVTHSWFTAGGEDGSGGIGLWGIKGEGRGGSMSFSWGELDDMGAKVPADIMIFGYVGMLAGLAAVAAAGATAAAAFTRNLHKLPTKPMLAAMGAASFAQTFFFVRIFTEDAVRKGGMGDFGPSFSPFLAIGGLITAGIVFKKMLMPHITAAKAGMPQHAASGGGASFSVGVGGFNVNVPMGGGQPQQPMAGQPMAGQPMAQAPMAAAPTVTCPRCQGQATFVAQYNRHFCNACQQYV